MTRTPILRDVTFETEDYDHRGNKVAVKHRFKVEGGLHMIRGNHAPYFGLTYTETGPYGFEAGGAGHEEILARYPEFADLAALHLSDIDGVPMHDTANAYYWLSGAAGGLGERFHGANRDHVHLDTGETQEGQALAILAKHLRVSENEARTITEDVRSVWFTCSPSDNATKHAKDRLAAIVNAMRPRWKAEAEACIARHGLVVYGDPWPAAT